MLTKPTYRPDVDGLRAIAVLSVIAFHAFPKLLPGGFIGVDVFFVISGYLITLIILSNLQSGSFSFAEFYARRIRRIFPALILVVGVTLVAGWFLILPVEYRQLGKHAAAASVFLSNFALLREAGYFDATAESKPLLHLWSLAIEEQFYLAWPLLLAVAWRRRRVGVALAAIGVASFAVNVYLIASRPEAAFYSPLSRFWELMIGGGLAFLSMRAAPPRKTLASCLSWTGAILLLVGLVLIDRDRRFPGWWALLPTIGTAFLIGAGASAPLNRTILAATPMVYIGRISYPLYLWHWSLLVLVGMYTLGELGAGGRLAVLGLGAALSAATYHYVETPIRARRLRPFTLGLAMSVLLALGAGIYISGGKPDRFDARQLAILDHFDHSLPAWHYFERHQVQARFRDDCNFYDIDAFRYGRTTRKVAGPIAASCYTPMPGKRTVLLWGDSHAQQLNHGLTMRLPPHWQVLQVASSGCNPEARNADRSSTDYCTYSNGFALEAVQAVKPDVVLIAQESAHNIDAVRATAAELLRRGAARVLVLGPVPHWRPMLYKILAARGPSNLPRYFSGGLDQGVMDLNNQLAAAIGPKGPIGYVNVIGYFCRPAGCLTFLGDDPVSGLTTFDYGHLTSPASVKLAEDVLVPMITSR